MLMIMMKLSSKLVTVDKNKWTLIAFQLETTKIKLFLKKITNSTTLIKNDIIIFRMIIKKRKNFPLKQDMDHF